MLASAAPPTEKGSVHHSSSEQDFLWNGPAPLLWTFQDQGLHTGCCNLLPLHPTSVWQEGPQGSNVKKAVWHFSFNVCHQRLPLVPSKERISGRLLFCDEIGGAKSGPSSSSSLHHPFHQPWYFFPSSFPSSHLNPRVQVQHLPPSSLFLLA